MRRLWHGFVFVVLTLLTQIGGVVWLLSVLFTRGRGLRAFLLVFIVLYTAAWMGTRIAAPSFDRIAIPCIDNGPTRARALSPLYCAMNRTYVVPELAAQLDGLAAHMHEQFPGARVRVLDGGFPFLSGMPLLPHLSHADGRKVDLALWYEGGNWRSPIGYWAFEQPGPRDPDLCEGNEGAMRWDMESLQPFMRDLPFDEVRTAEALRWLDANLPSDGKVFIEPHLADRMGVDGAKIRFQGCGAARHDDHIHVQL